MRVLLADDQPEIRSALRLLLEQESSVVVVGEADETDSLLRQVSICDPEVVMLDWELPSGCCQGTKDEVARGTVRGLRALRPGSKIVALSGRPEARLAAQSAGVDAFVSKGDPPEQVIAALRALAEARADPCLNRPGRMASATTDHVSTLYLPRCPARLGRFPSMLTPEAQERGMQMRVLLADGQSDVRSALRLLLEEEGDLEVVGEATAASGLLNVAEATEPDVVMMQWELPLGWEQRDHMGCQRRVIGALRRSLPELGVVTYSGWPDARKASLLAGANGFVNIGDTSENLLATLRAAVAGGTK